MFDIGWSEILLIAIVAIVVVGPKDLPPMLRAAGRMVSKLRKTAGEFQSQFNEALREAELDGVKDSINEIRGLNPMNEIRKSLDPIQAALAKPEPVARPAPEPVPPPANQLAQPMTDADLVPAANPLPVERPAEAKVVATDPKPAPRKRKPKAEAPVAVAAEGEPAVAKAPAKRVAKPKVAADEPAAVEGEVPAKKPRSSKAKAAAVPAAPEASTQPAAMTGEPIQRDLAFTLPDHAPLAPTASPAPLPANLPSVDVQSTEIVAAPTQAPPAEERS